MDIAVYGTSNLLSYGITANVPGWNVWGRMPDFATKGTVLLMSGPKDSLNAVIAAVTSLNGFSSYDPSVSEGSAKASLRVLYDVASISMNVPPAGDRRFPTVSLTPSVVTADVCAHPYFKGIAPSIRVIERMLQLGKITPPSKLPTGESPGDYLLGQFTDPNGKERKLAALLSAGVRQYEVFGLNLTVTRHYYPTSTINNAADFTALNKVFAWGNISCGGFKPSIAAAAEPKAVLPNESGTFMPTSLEWRCTGVGAVIQRQSESTVTWTFQGAEKWLALFYSGGSGEYKI